MEESARDDEYVLDGFVVGDTSEDQPAPAPTGSALDIDIANIVTGKRKRRATRTIYEEPDFATAICEQMMQDVPEAEITAAIADDCDDAVILTSDEESDEENDEKPSGDAGGDASSFSGSDAPSDDEDYIEESTGDDDDDDMDEDDDVVTDNDDD